MQGRADGGHEGNMGGGDHLPIHGSLWERGLALEKRREAGARSREDARKARASAGHVNGRSAELVRAMRVRSLVQTYRTLLASVEYARLPEGLDYDEVWRGGWCWGKSEAATNLRASNLHPSCRRTMDRVGHG